MFYLHFNATKEHKKISQSNQLLRMEWAFKHQDMLRFCLKLNKAFHAGVRGSVPGLGGLKEIQLFLLHPRVKVSIVGSLRDRE